MPALVAKAAEAPEVEAAEAKAACHVLLRCYVAAEARQVDAAEAKAAYDLRCCLLIRLVPQQVIDSSCIAGSSGCG